MLRFLGHQQKCGGLGKRMAAKKGFRTSSLCRSYNDDEQPRSLSGDQKKPRKPRLQKTGGKKFKANIDGRTKRGGGRERRRVGGGERVNFFSMSFSSILVAVLKNLEVTFYRRFFCAREETSVAQGQRLLTLVSFFYERFFQLTQRKLNLVEPPRTDGKLEGLILAFAGSLNLKERSNLAFQEYLARNSWNFISLSKDINKSAFMQVQEFHFIVSNFQNYSDFKKLQKTREMT